MSLRSTFARLVDALTARAPVQGGTASPEASLGTVETSEVALWAQVGRIGGMLTPNDISTIILQADSGSPYRLVDLMHECRQKDGHLQAVLGTRELSVVGLDWELELPDNAKRRDRKANEALEAALRACDTFPLLIAHEVGEANLFGYAFSECVWKYHNRGELKGLLAPDRFIPVHCRRFGYRQSDGALLFVPEAYGSPDNSGVDLLTAFAPGKYIGYRPRINGDVTVREGLARVLVWLACFRNWDVRDWLQLGEISWKPWRIGTYKRGAGREDIAILKQAVRQLTTLGSAVLPETAAIDINKLASASTGTIGSVHKELLDALAAEMSKAVLGGTLTVESGSRGARSLGDVHDRVRLDIREADARGTNAFVTQHVCRPFIRHNYGENVLVGRFKLRTAEGVDLEKLANAVDKLAGKIDIPQSWVREQGGIAAPKPGEQLVLFTGSPDPSPSPKPPPKNDDKPKAQRTQTQIQQQELFESGDERVGDEAA